VCAVVGHVVVSPAAHADPTLVLEDAALPSWSPDGSSMVCVRSFPDWYDLANAQFWLAPLAGAPTRLGAIAGASWPLWLSDGQHIAYHRRRDIRPDPGLVYEFVVVDLQGENPVVWQVPYLWDDPGMSLSPDGGHVLYSQGGNAPAETWSLDLATGVRTLVVAGSGGVISPDGAWIAYGNQQGDFVIAPIGLPPVRNLGGNAFDGSWTPDSRYIVVTRIVNNQFDLFIASREGTYLRALTNDPEMEWYARVSPSGDRVAYTRTLGESGIPSIYAVSLPPVGVEEKTWTRIKQIYR